MEITVVFMLALFVLFTAGSDNNKERPVAQHQKLGSRYERLANPSEPKIEKINDISYTASVAPVEPKKEQVTYIEPRESDKLEKIVQDVQTPAKITYRHISLQRVSKIALKYNQYLKPEEINTIYQSLDDSCHKKNIDPALILGLIARESSFNPYAISSSGAKGLGQIMEFNYDVLGVNNPYDIKENIRGTVVYFQQKLYDFKDEIDPARLALAAYKEGSGAIKRSNLSCTEHTASYIEDIMSIRQEI